jgi:hypothetical protein
LSPGGGIGGKNLNQINAAQGAQGWGRKNLNNINAAQGAQGAPGGLIAETWKMRRASRARLSFFLFSFVVSNASGR